MLKSSLLVFIIGLLGGLFGGLTGRAENNIGWTVKHKAELLTHVISYGQRCEYVPFDQKNKGKLIFYLARKVEYLSIPQEQKLEVADRIFDIVFRYVLADSIGYFSEVSFIFFNDKDSTVYFKVPYNLALRLNTKVKSYSTEERFELLSNLLPLPHLKIENPSQTYKDRFMGFAFPLEQDGVKFDEIAIGNYSIDLAAIMYDFVLRRNNKIVSRILVQYNTTDKYTDIHAVPEYRNEYFIAAEFFTLIKKHNSTIIFKD
ncbi:MAG: hypothetical protein P4L51_23650 [Puia sp.]|nr:hypothetical protein [Puia sp.]